MSSQTSSKVGVNVDLVALGSHLAVRGGGRSGEDCAPFGWRDIPDFLKDIDRKDYLCAVAFGEGQSC